MVLSQRKSKGKSQRKSKHILKASIALIALTAIIGLSSGCQTTNVVVETKVKPVEVVSLKTESRNTKVQYYGYVLPEYVKKYSFSTGGTLEPITLQSGDQVKLGDVLAAVKPDKLNIAVKSAKEESELASLQVQKAKTALDYLQKTVTDAKGMMETGTMTKQQFDELVLRRDIALKDLELAQGQEAQAKLQGQYQQKNRADAVLYADVEGIVAQVLYESGELIAPGYPVMIVKSIGNVISISMTAADSQGLEIGDLANATDGKKNWPVKVIEKSVLPDEKTRTYEVKFAIDGQNQPYVGELLSVEMIQSSIEGIWLPINSILNDGVDYVYIVEDNRAVRKNITLKMRVDDEVAVDGLKPEDQLITKGTASISHGYKVQVLEGGNE